jgi:hypothetical protein
MGMGYAAERRQQKAYRGFARISADQKKMPKSPGLPKLMIENRSLSHHGDSYARVEIRVYPSESGVEFLGFPITRFGSLLSRTSSEVSP